MLPLLILTSLARRFRSFYNHKTASVSIIFGVWLLPLVMTATVAVDYSTVSNARTSLHAMADAAALAGVSTTIVHSLSGRADMKEAIRANVEADFNGQLAAKRPVQTAVKNAAVETTIHDGLLTTKICYSAEVRTFFGRLLGRSAVTVANCVKAKASVPAYYSIHAIVDASGSMGIGASVSDQVLMQNRLGCAFACHTTNWGQPTLAPKCDTKNYQSQVPNCAKMIGAKLRFDIVRDRLIDLVNKAASHNKLPGQFSFSLHKFSTKPTLIQPTTTDLRRVKTAILDMTMDQAGAGTNVRYAMQSILASIPRGGDGSSAASPKVFVILLTDGVENNVVQDCTFRPGYSTCNYWGGWSIDRRFLTNSPGFNEGPQRIQVMDPTICTPFKEKGATVLTITTEYLTPPGSLNTKFRSIQSLLVPEIRTRMKDCASGPEFAYLATTPVDIERAMQKVFGQIVIRPQITF
jgi:hypothetical protein